MSFIYLTQYLKYGDFQIEDGLMTHHENPYKVKNNKSIIIDINLYEPLISWSIFSHITLPYK